MQSRQLAKTDHIRTRIIGGPCATHGTHLHVDTGPCAKDAESPCDVSGGESEVLLCISNDVLTCHNLMSIDQAPYAFRWRSRRAFITLRGPVQEYINQRRWSKASE